MWGEMLKTVVDTVRETLPGNADTNSGTELSACAKTKTLNNVVDVHRLNEQFPDAWGVTHSIRQKEQNGLQDALTIEHARRNVEYTIVPNELTDPTGTCKLFYLDKTGTEELIGTIDSMRDAIGESIRRTMTITEDGLPRVEETTADNDTTQAQPQQPAKLNT
jgi:hypothetical protein